MKCVSIHSTAFIIFVDMIYCYCLSVLNSRYWNVFQQKKYWLGENFLFLWQIILLLQNLAKELKINVWLHIWMLDWCINICLCLNNENVTVFRFSMLLKCCMLLCFFFSSIVLKPHFNCTKHNLLMQTTFLDCFVRIMGKGALVEPCMQMIFFYFVMHILCLGFSYISVHTYKMIFLCKLHWILFLFVTSCCWIISLCKLKMFFLLSVIISGETYLQYYAEKKYWQCVYLKITNVYNSASTKTTDQRAKLLTLPCKYKLAWLLQCVFDYQNVTCFLSA